MSMHVSASPMKKANDLGDFTPINQAKFNNNLDVFRDMEPEARANFVQEVKNKYSQVLKDDLTSVQSELNKINTRIGKLYVDAEQLEKNSHEVRDKTTAQEDAIESISKQIDALTDDTKKMKGEEVALKEAKSQLTDSRNKDLKACCDKQKAFDKVKKLINGKFSADRVVQGIMDGIFQFCYGPNAKYDAQSRIMSSIDDFNTGVRGATCTLDKDFVKSLMDSKIKGGDNAETQGEYYKHLIADTDKDLVLIIPFYKLLSRMCHLQMHLFKFEKNQKKQGLNTKKIEAHQVEIETHEAVIEALSFHADLNAEAQHMNDVEISSIKKKQERLEDKIKEIQEK